MKITVNYLDCAPTGLLIALAPRSRLPRRSRYHVIVVRHEKIFDILILIQGLYLSYPVDPLSGLAECGLYWEQRCQRLLFRSEIKVIFFELSNYFLVIGIQSS